MTGDAIRQAAERRATEAIARLKEFAAIESPTEDAGAVETMQRRLAAEFDRRDYRVRWIRRPGAGPHLLAVPRNRVRGRPLQLVLGHADTVWPVGTLDAMPIRETDGRLHGPGTFDMKAGIAGLFTAIDLLADAGTDLTHDPIVLITADEEVGSPTSKTLVGRVARTVERCWVLEPPKGAEGALKTVRKGMVKTRIDVRGRPAHAGLDPGVGASAIQEAAHLTLALHALQDLDRGISFNVGRIEGGTRPNVVAARVVLECDARAPTVTDADELMERVRSLRPTVPGTELDVDTRLEVPPLEPSPANRALWSMARAAGESIGLHAEEAHVGGASDGNTAARFTAVLDGLGWVGDGAHADHEHIVLDRVGERIALLAALLAAP